MARLTLPKVTVEPFLFLCMYACFLTWITFPQLILDSICLSKHNQTRCAAMFIGAYKTDYDIVQEQATLWFGGFLVIVTLIAILTLPFVGSISDRFGRYAAMFLTPVSQLLQGLALLGILVNGLKFPTWAYLLPGLMPALVGDVSGLYVLTGSYISDISQEKTRTLRLTLLDSVVLIAGLLATLCSGFIIEEFGYAGIYVTNITSLILALVYLIFCVAPVKHKQGKSSRQANIVEEEENSFLDKDESEALTKAEEVIVVKEGGQELNIEKLDGRNDDFRNSSLSEASGNCLTRETIDESSFISKEENTAIPYRVVCKLAKKNALDDTGSLSEVSSAERKTCFNVWDDSRVDGGFDEWNEEGAGDVNENSGIGEGYCSLNEATKTHSSKSKTGIVDQRESDLVSDTVMDEIPCQLSSFNDHPLPMIKNADHCSTEQSTRADQKSRTNNFQKVLPQAEVLSEFENENALFRFQLIHILKDSNPVRNLKRVYRVLKVEDEAFNGLILFLLIFLSAICYSGEMSVLALYLKNRPYFLNARDLGLYFAYESGIIAILGLVIFNYLFTRVIKMEDHLLLLVSFCCSTVYYALLSVAQSLLMLYLIQLVHSVGSLNICIIRSLMSKMISASTTGLLFGALFMFETAGVLFGALICPVVYSKVAVTYPGAVFFINGGLSLFSIFTVSVLLLKIKKRKRNDTKRKLDAIVYDSS